MSQARVALVRGDDRYDNIARALDLLAGQVDLSGRHSVLIKPNLVSTRRPLAVTHADALRAVFDFVRARYTGRLILAEGAGDCKTWEGFCRFGYHELAERYGAELLDLNGDDMTPVQVYDRHLRPRTLRLARTVVDSDFRISVGPPKTHDYVVITASIKNMIMGTLVNRTLLVQHDVFHRSPVDSLAALMPRRARESWRWQVLKYRLGHGERSDRLAMHQGYPVLNLNLAMLAPWVQPHLAVIDGFQGMEGAGPADGDPVDWRVALAGSDAVAVDSLTAHLMGFRPADIGYLDYCRRLGYGIGDLGQIQVVGGVEPDAARRTFRPHPMIAEQRQWQMEGVERWLHPARRPELSTAAD